MARLRHDGKLSFCVSPVYKPDQISFKLCFLNARSLHKHIDDVREDLNYSSTDVNKLFLQRQDMLVLITMIFMLLMGIVYLEMIVRQLVVRGLMEEQQCIVVLITTQTIHIVVTQMVLTSLY